MKKGIVSFVAVFVVGGAFGVIAQLCYDIAGLVFGADFAFLLPAGLIILGFVSAALWAIGVYQKLEKIGGYGAILQVGGCATACAAAYVGVKKATSSERAAIKAGIKPVIPMIVIAVGVSFVLGLISAII